MPQENVAYRKTSDELDADAYAIAELHSGAPNQHEGRHRQGAYAHTTTPDMGSRSMDGKSATVMSARVWPKSDEDDTR